MQSRHLLATCFTLSLLLSTSGCQQYGEVSPRTYEISKALYSACNRKSEEHLEQVADLVSESAKTGEITADEQEWLQNIVRKAESGNWEEAMLDARQMMEEQQD